MIVINLILLISSILAVLWLINQFIYPTWLLKQKYKVYAIRDDLANLVLTRRIEESDDDYNFLKSSIRNTLVFYERDFSVTTFVKSIVLSEQRTEEKKKFLERVERIKKNPLLAPIQKEIFAEMQIAFKRETFALRGIIPILYYGSKVVFFVLQIIRQDLHEFRQRMRYFSTDPSKLKDFEEDYIQPALS